MKVVQVATLPVLFERASEVEASLHLSRSGRNGHLPYLSLDGTEWSFARLSDNSDEQSYESSGNSQAGQGRLLKTWGLESVCYDNEREYCTS